MDTVVEGDSSGLEAHEYKLRLKAERELQEQSITSLIASLKKIILTAVNEVATAHLQPANQSAKTTEKLLRTLHGMGASVRKLEDQKSSMASVSTKMETVGSTGGANADVSGLIKREITSDCRTRAKSTEDCEKSTRYGKASHEASDHGASKVMQALVERAHAIRQDLTASKAGASDDTCGDELSLELSPDNETGLRNDQGGYVTSQSPVQFGDKSIIEDVRLHVIEEARDRGRRWGSVDRPKQLAPNTELPAQQQVTSLDYKRARACTELKFNSPASGISQSRKKAVVRPTKPVP